MVSGISDGAVKWYSAGDFGQPAATDARNGVATPLLAGFSIALLASIGQAPNLFRWPGMTMFVLVLTIGLFATSLQLGLRSRSLLYSRDDAMSWGKLNDYPAQEDEAARAELQRRHLILWRRSYRWVQLSYNGAIVVLALGLSFTAAPPTSYGSGRLSTSEDVWRWAAFSLGLLLTTLQFSWSGHDEILRHRARRKAPRRDDLIDWGKRR